MKQCLGCRGLVPSSLDTCPNCAVEPRSGFKKLLAASGLVALVSSSCLAVPVYGAPCTSKQLDGGNKGCFGQCDVVLEDGGSPANDPQNECFVPDGGTP